MFGALEFALDWRYTTVSIAVALFLCTLGIISSGYMQFSFFPPLQGEYVSAELTMPRGTPARVTAEAVATIEAAAAWLRGQKGVHKTNLSVVGLGSGCALAVRHAARDENW